MKRRSITMVVATLIGVAAGNPTGNGVDSAIEVRLVEQLTGPFTENRTHSVGVDGTDLGSMFELDGRVFFLFGDTFAPSSGPMSGAGWRSNTMAHATDLDASDGIRLDGWIRDPVFGWAAEIISSRKHPNGYGERTVIPTSGIAVDGVVYVFYQSVHEWGDPGHWTANHGGIAMSEDGGHTFTKHEPMWPGDSAFVQVTVARDTEGQGPEDGGLFVWGIPAGRQGAVHLAWVPEQRLIDADAYRYYAGGNGGGGPRWRGIEDAQPIIAPTNGELSVMWNRWLRRWVLTTLVDPWPQPATLVMRLSRLPWGPWSDAIPILTAAGFSQLYGGFMHPRYVADGGRVLYLLVSKFDAYNVFLFEVTFDPSMAGRTRHLARRLNPRR